MSGAGPELKKTLNQRQLTMIAMGGVIGAGLFVGSGTVIKAPARARSSPTPLCGVLIIMVMRMLAEMCRGQPVDGLVRRLLPQGARRLGGLLGRLAHWYFWSSSSGSRRWRAPRSSTSGCRACRRGC